jgi:hypothetical protein
MGHSPKRKNARKVKFDFEPMNDKSPQWAPKLAKFSGVKFEFGFRKVVVGGPKNWQKRQKN